MKVVLTALVSLSVACLGCDRETPSQNKTTSDQVAAASAVHQETKVTDVAAESGLDEESVKTFVESWLLVQNGGKFADYEHLYAEKMLGVKRVGAHEQRFDHKGWLEDRKAMFARPFHVEVSDLRVTISSGVAIVRFKQVWSSATFRDEGQKQLVIANEGGHLRVSREEMLDSLLKAAPKVKSLSPDQLGLVRIDGGEIRLLLSSDPKLEWMTGHPTFSAGGRVVRAVEQALVPAAQRDLIGKTFELFDATGARCEAKAQQLEVFVDVIPHFGRAQIWEGGQYADGAPPTPRAQIALELWGMSEVGGRYLSVRVQPLGASACGAPVWGRVVNPDVSLWVASVPSENEKERLATFARRDPDFKAYLNDKDAVAATGFNIEASARRARVFTHADGRRYAAVELGAPSDVCGGYDLVPYWVLLRINGSYAQIISNGELGAGVQFPFAAASVAGLDEPVFVSDNHVLRWVSADGLYHITQEWGPLDLDCAC